MCGIVAYIGNKQALPVLLQGLRDLEYRGYDSAGVVILNEGKFSRVREIGKVDRLSKKIDAFRRRSEGVRPTEEPQNSSKEILRASDALGAQDDGIFRGTIGIAHTRWATHGGVTEFNAHPHIVNNELAVVHNGIIENYRELKEKLLNDGFEFQSETDTEVLACLIYKEYKHLEKAGMKAGASHILREAVRSALLQVRGTYGLVVMHKNHPFEFIAARLGSPLVIGYGDGENYIASDPTPILPYTKRMAFLDDGEIAVIDTGTPKISNLNNELVAKVLSNIEWDQQKAQKGGFEHFMLKEIFDQPVVFEDALRGRLDMEEGTAKLGGLNMTLEQMASIKRVIIIAEGTAKLAGLIGKYAFERLANLPVEVDSSSEFRYRDPIVNKSTLAFVISQSGETADTIMAVREAKRKGAFVRSIVNVVGSTIARETGAGTYIHAGPELSVASTKAYSNMIAILMLYALQFGRLKHTSLATGQRMLQALLEIPEKMNEVLKQNDEIKNIAKQYIKYHNILYIGRGVNYPVALEGALKLKEISYIHAEGFAGGELKHGPLALVSKDVPVIAILTKNQLYEKMKSSIQEVRARGARTLVIANDEDAKEVADDIIYVPKTMELLEPLLNTIPLQLFAYHMAVALGRDVDRPRNLAKSVTVE
jgi:glucosamine--fructose-6-phosphate aminotransferase (isomerizing)